MKALEFLRAEAMAWATVSWCSTKVSFASSALPTDVYDNPADTFVANLSSSPPMNLARALVTDRRLPPRALPLVSTVTDAAVPFRFQSRKYRISGLGVGLFRGH